MNYKSFGSMPSLHKIGSTYTIISGYATPNTISLSRKNIRTIVFCTVLLCFQTMSYASVLKGYILDKESKEPLIGATVKIVGTSTGTTADLDGHYIMQGLKQGMHTLEVQYIGYKKQTTTVEIKGEERVLDFPMESNLNVLGEVKIFGRKNMENENILKMERQNSSFAIENIGANEMSAKGVSNAQEGVKKIAGVSVAQQGQLVVRGLGDRYSITTLNGMPIASPNPDNKLIPLDIFPSMSVKNITITKVYEAGSFADYSGARIDIGTKENTGEDFFSVNFSVGGGLNSIGQDFYFSNRKGSMFNTNNINHKYLEMPLSEFEQTVIKEDPFGTAFSIKNKTAIPDFSGSIGGGKTWELPDNSSISFLASLGINNSSKVIKNAFTTTLTAQGNELNKFDYNSYESDLQIAGLFNMGYNFRAKDIISYTVFYARNAENMYKERSGFDSEGVNLLGSNSVFHAYSLLNNQVMGHHEFNKEKWALDWNVSYSVTASDEPDRRQVMFRKDPITGKPYELFTLNQQETMRYFGELNENEIVGDIRSSYKFNDKGLFRFGAAYKNKSRDFMCARFYYNLKNLDAQITDIYNTDDYLNHENIANGSIIVSRNMQPRNKYNALNSIYAGFVEFEYEFLKKVLLSLGLRYENSLQKVNYFSDGGTALEANLISSDFFPALNLKYNISKEHNLRLSVSRTITRPSFIEMAPFLYQESYGSSSIRGNADLQNGYNVNLDLRYDFFPKNGVDIISITPYFKYLQDPIERIQQAEGGSTVHSFKNAEDGIAAGVEIEVKKKIFKDFGLGLNFSYMYTNVTLQEDGGIYTDNSRALQGASPYILNLDVSYSPDFGSKGKLRMSIIYNLQGPRIHTVGVFGLGNVVQQTLHTLDFVAGYEINKHFSLKFKVRDMLNTTVLFKQDVPETGEEIAVEAFKPGVRAEIGISYKF